MNRALLIACASLFAWVALGCQTETTVGSNFRELPDAYTPPSLPSCGDGVDNDSDTLVDYPFDPGCESPRDESETDPAVPPACADGADNDGDSIVDFPFEPGCESAGDDDETDPAALPECSDGVDNDGDLLTDYPDDTGCESAGGLFEAEVTS